jgi:hypothetical protein
MVIVKSTGIGSGIVAVVKDRLQVQHDVGSIIGQRNTDARQALS